MTRGDYLKSIELLSNQDIYGFTERLCERMAFDAIKQYPQTVNSEVMKSAARKRMYVERVIDLIRRMIFLGATKQEMLRAAGYLMVMMKSMDNSLDYRSCEKDMLISELESKYSTKEFLSWDVTLEELQDVIKRDEGYYGVRIKK